jgi:hypothetical protein
MDVIDMISGPLLFVQRLHEHSTKVHEAVELIPALVDALLAQDYEKMDMLHGQMSKIRSETDQVKLALYGQIKDIRFRSPGSHAFSQYIGCQDKVADAASDFADLLMVRKTTIPVELRAGFQAFVAHVVGTSRQPVSLAKELFSSEEAVSTAPQAQGAAEAIAGITEGNRRAKRLGMEFAQHVYSLEGRLDPGTIQFLDKYSTALRGITDAAERAADHLRLMIP